MTTITIAGFPFPAYPLRGGSVLVDLRLPAVGLAENNPQFFPAVLHDTMGLPPELVVAASYSEPPGFAYYDPRLHETRGNA